MDSDAEHGLDRVVGAVDSAVPDADSAISNMSEAEERAVARAGLVFTVCAVVLIPWTVYLAWELPRRAVAGHYDIAWAGFDVMLAAALFAVAWTSLRRSDWLPVAGAWAAALLITDAWFDVMTSHGRWQILTAAAMAVLVELPLAAASIWLCRHAGQVQQRQRRRFTRR